MTDVTTRFILQADQAGANATRALLQGVASDIKALGASDPLKAANVGLEGLSEEAKSLGGRFSEAHSQLNLLKGDFKELEVAASQIAKTPLVDPASIKELEDLRKELVDGASPAKASGGASSSGEDGGSGPNFLTRAGSAIRSLPSQRIPGLNIGTDAIGNFARLGGAALDAAKASGVLAAAQTASSAVTEAYAAVTSTLTAIKTGDVTVTEVLTAAYTTVSGAALAAAEGTFTFLAALSPLAVIGAALAGVFVGLAAAAAIASQQAKQANEDLKEAYAARRDIQAFIRSGATSEDAKKKLDEIQATLEDEQNNLAEAKQNYADAFNQVANGIPILGDLFARIADFFGAFGAVKEEAATAEKAVKKQSEEQRFLTAALEKGKFAAADRAEAEKKATDEKKKADEEAKQKEEQRLKDIEAVNKQIADSDRTYAFKRADLAAANEQKLADLDQANKDKQQDIDRKYFNDVQNIALKARREEVDAQTKTQRADQDALFKARVAEVNATIKQQRDLQDIKDAAIQDEKKALEDRNFLEASLAGEKGQAAIDKAKKDAERAAEDRKAAFDIDKRERNIKDAQDANDRILKTRREREDRATAFKEEQAQAATAYQRQLRDADTNFKRQEDAAALAYEREQDQLAKHLEELTGIRAEGYAAEKAAAMGQSAPLRSGSGSTTNNNTSSNRTVNDSRSLVIDLTGGGAAIIEQARRAAMDVMRRTAY